MVHCRYGPPVHRPQLPTPPRGGAVEVGFRREQPNSTGGTFPRVPANFAGAAFYLLLPMPRRVNRTQVVRMSEAASRDGLAHFAGRSDP